MKEQIDYLDLAIRLTPKWNKPRLALLKRIKRDLLKLDEGDRLKRG